MFILKPLHGKWIEGKEFLCNPYVVSLTNLVIKIRGKNVYFGVDQINDL